MNKNELMNLMLDVINGDNYTYKLNTMQAKIFDNHNFAVLVSYKTPVAIYSHKSKAIAVLDYYSQSTTKQVNAFIELMVNKFSVVNVVYLFERRDRIAINEYNQRGEITWNQKYTREELEQNRRNNWETAIKYDFLGL